MNPPPGFPPPSSGGVHVAQMLNILEAMGTKMPKPGTPEFIHRITEVMKLAFGTEGGLFTARLGVPVVVCGPGSITQAHKPDEYVELDQLAQCDAFLAKLLGQLQAA